VLLRSERACYSVRVSSRLSQSINKGGIIGYYYLDDLRIDEPGIYKLDSLYARCDHAKSPLLAFKFAF
jgi:hypothetical protein